MRATAALAAAALMVAGLGGGRTPPGDPVPAEGSIADADAHYARRAAGHAGARAASLEISDAVEGYERAAVDARNAEARWKLARALYFLGTYTALDEAGRMMAFARARRFGEEAIAIVGRRKGNTRIRAISPEAAAAVCAGDPDAAPSYFWSAVSWGQWALASGRFEAARHGAADRIRDDCSTLIRLDPKFEEGGGYRILGRLHDQAPRIPLLTGWVSRAEAIRNLRLSVEVAPANLVNRHFLAEALHKGDRAQKEEAVRIEQQIVRDAPSEAHLVEELALQNQARYNLAGWKTSR
jgi:tetratricopeptide (TPR) repeat protein